MILASRATQAAAQGAPPTDVNHNPVIPADPMEAPAYGNYTAFPNTNYLVGQNLMYWRKINDLTALLREDGKHYSIKEFIKPDEVAQYSFAVDPLEAAISEMFLRTVEVPYLVDPGGGDYWRYPLDTLAVGGDCEDTAFLMESMALNRMAECYMAAGYFLGDRPFGHAWVVVRLPGKGEFLYETTLDFRPSSLWIEVHNSPIAQYYVPFLYWNLTDIFVTNDLYAQVLTQPYVSTLAKQIITENTTAPQPPGAEVPHLILEESDSKRQQIHNLWSGGG